MQSFACIFTEEPDKRFQSIEVGEYIKTECSLSNTRREEGGQEEWKEWRSVVPYRVEVNTAWI